MLFNEIYSSYFNVVAKVLERAVNGNLSETDINSIVLENGFGESILNIPHSLKSEKWKLISSDMKTPLQNIPSMPLTLLQKRWLKTLLNDPKIKLFSPVADDGLDDIDPLFDLNSIEYFDRYSDGDDYSNPEYIHNFHEILKGLKQNHKLKLKYKGKQNREKELYCSPVRLEYSAKDDKFRLYAIAYKKLLTLNLSRISDAELTNFEINDDIYKYKSNTNTLIFELTNERKALERIMLCFSHLEKQAEKLDNLHYRITLKYDEADENEMIIRILSFGPMIKVISPDSIIEELKSRIEKQKSCEA